jgi:protein phosphatase
MNEQAVFWTSASATHTGLVRRLNEDACLELPERGLWVVADGMGGHAAGDLASGMLVESLRNIARAGSLDDLSTEVRRTLQRVNRKLTQEARRRNQQIIGCTVAALLIHGRQAQCLWAGDSRIYLWRDHRLQQLTRDHSQAEELIARGLLNREQAGTFPGASAITRAVGVMERLELERLSLEVHDGDGFLLCSDGLYNEVEPQDFEPILTMPDCRSAVQQLIHRALQGKARDNITAVLVRIEQDQITKTQFNPAAVRREASGQEDADKTTLNNTDPYQPHED